MKLTSLSNEFRRTAYLVTMLHIRGNAIEIESVRVSAMEAAPVENSHSVSPPENTGHHLANSVPDPQRDREMEPNHEISEEEATSIMEVIAAIGKFWHDWDILRSLLSSRLKQVLAEYTEAQIVEDMIGPQPSSLSEETYPELVKRLDEVLLTFVEGPPFTLQRLCEILLNARNIYPNLSKLALALEKNLLVTSTLTMSTDPYPLTASYKAIEHEKESNKPEARPSPTENGTEAVTNGDYGNAKELRCKDQRACHCEC